LELLNNNNVLVAKCMLVAKKSFQFEHNVIKHIHAHIHLYLKFILFGDIVSNTNIKYVRYVLHRILLSLHKTTVRSESKIIRNWS